MTQRTLVSVGPSLMEGSELNSSFAQGGKGAWPELVAERLANLPNVGPMNSSGLRCGWLGDGTVSYAGAWADVTGADLFDKAPYGWGKYSAGGTTAIVTHTRSSRLRAVVGFYYYWIDLLRTSGTQGGVGSYRVDGGAWTALPSTIANDNAIKRAWISTAVTSTVEVRAANAAGTAVGVFPVGVEWGYRDLSSVTDGFTWHNLGRNGASICDLVGGTGNTTVGNRMAAITLIAPTEGTLVMEGTDPSTVASTSQWNTDLTTIKNYADDFGPVWFLNFYELSEYPTVPNSQSPGYPFTTQTSYRAQTKTTATNIGATSTFDLFDEWKAFGLGGEGAQNLAARGTIAFIYNQDNGHELANGHFDIARRIYGWLKAQLGYSGPSTYTAKGKATSLACKGKQSSVAAYTAAAPIAVVPV